MIRPGLCRALVLFVGLCSFATAPAMAEDAGAIPGDPWESFNRRMQAFNDGADRIVLKPLATGYRAVMPDPFERGVSNFFVNLGTPRVAINQLLQGKPKLAVADTGRFLINTTIGLGGILDAAGDMGLEAHDEDFGQTLAKWGVGSGPYLVLPIWGPSTLRDGFSDIVDSAFYPPNYVDDDAIRGGLLFVYALDTRAQLLGTESLISGDRYTFFREAYRQRREFLINDGEVEDSLLDDDF